MLDALPAPGKKNINPWLVAVTVGLAAFMEVLDISIANVALRHIAGSLSASQDESTWVLTSYLVTNAVILLMSGWFSNVIGRRLYFLGCIAGFSLTSLFCGLAPNLGLLIAFRGLQGLLGGGLQPCAQAILADAFPPHKRSMAFAIYGLAVVCAPAIGPTLGGWLTDNFSWRWVFLINVPIGIALTFTAMRIIQDPEEYGVNRRKKLSSGFHVDYVGFILLCIGMGALQIVLDRGQIDDWFHSKFILTLSVAAAAGLVFFILWELNTKHPLVEFSLLKNMNFAIGNLLMLFLGFILLGSTVLLPEFAQNVLGYTSTDAGLVISPGGLALVFLMPLVGALSSRVDARIMIAFGIIVCSTSLFYMTNFNQDTDYSALAWGRLYQAFGLGFLFIPINSISFHGLPPGKTSNASAIINMTRNVGGSFGISVVTAMLSRRAQVHQNTLVNHITSTSAEYRTFLQGIQQHLQYSHSSSVDALHQSQAIIYNIIQQQAIILAYVDDFEMLGFLFLILVPFLLLIRKPDIGKAEVPSHQEH